VLKEPQLTISFEDDVVYSASRAELQNHLVRSQLPDAGLA